MHSTEVPNNKILSWLEKSGCQLGRKQIKNVNGNMFSAQGWKLSVMQAHHTSNANKDGLPIIYTLLAMNVICRGLGTSLQWLVMRLVITQPTCISIKVQVAQISSLLIAIATFALVYVNRSYEVPSGSQHK